MKRFNPYKLFNGSFVPEAVSRIPRKELSDGAKLVYGRLMRYSGKHGICKPKRKTIMGEVGYASLSTLDRKITELVEFKLLEKVQRGLHKSNEYFFPMHPIFEDSLQGRGLGVVKDDGTESSDMVVPSIEESQVKRVNEESQESAYTKLPPTLGKTRQQRIMRIYSKLWQREFNSNLVVNFPRFGKAIKSYDDLSEPQVAVLILTHFNWFGMSGSDEFMHKKLFNAGFPIEWIVNSQSQYVAFLKNNEGVDFNNEKSVYSWLSKQIKKLKTI